MMTVKFSLKLITLDQEMTYEVCIPRNSYVIVIRIKNQNIAIKYIILIRRKPITLVVKALINKKKKQI